MRKVKTEYPPGSGKMRDAVSVPVKLAQEPWIEYELEDGAIIRLRTTLIECFRVVDEFDQFGNPIYQLQANTSMTVNAPDSLKPKRQ